MSEAIGDLSALRTLWDARALRPLFDADDAHADEPAIIFVRSDAEPVTLTRRQFAQQTAHTADALRQLGLAPALDGESPVVLIAHTQHLDSIVAFWACLLLGAIPSMVPTLTEKLDPDHYRRNLGEVVRVAQARAVLTTDDFAPVLRETLACAVFSAAQVDGVTPKPAPVVPHAAPPPENIAFLQHSSGTTGLQKGVALSHRAVLAQIASYAGVLGLRHDDVIASWLPLYHDMGLIAGFLLPLITGVPLVLMSPFDWVAHPALLLRAIHDYRATLCWLPNFACNHMAQRVRQRDSDGLDLSSMRAFINCSEPVRAASHAQFLARFAANGVRADQLAVSYAMAENTFAVTQTPIGQPARIDWIDREALQRDLRAEPVSPDHLRAAAQVSCGPAIPNTSVKVVDDGGNTLPERQIGELMVISDCMLTGYYRRPDVQPFDADGWYRTGDRGYLAEGEVYVVGRSKDLLIIAGKNVYPQDIEALLYEIDGIHPGRAVAFGVPDEREGTELLAVLAELDGEDEETKRRLQVAVRQHIARSSEVTVSYVTFVPRGWLIKTSSGKTARAANRDKWLAERAS